MSLIRNPHLVLRLHKPARTERPANRVPDESSAGGEAGRKELPDRLAECVASCDCPADVSQALQDEWKGWRE